MTLDGFTFRMKRTQSIYQFYTLLNR